MKIEKLFYLSICFCFVLTVSSCNHSNPKYGALPSLPDSSELEASSSSPNLSLSSESQRMDSADYSSTSMLKPVGLCDIVKGMEAGAGTYRVDAIIQDPKQYPGQTFVKLTRVDAWTQGAPKKTILKYRTGPTPDGSIISRGNMPSFTVGEEIGVLLNAYPNQKYTIAHTQRLFRTHQSEITNGRRLFKNKGHSMKKVGRMVRDLHLALEKGKSCPFDVKPTPTKDRPNKNNGSTPVKHIETQEGY